MNRNITKKVLMDLVSETTISGEKITKRAQGTSKTQNKAYYKDVEGKMGEYDKNLKQEDDDKIDPKKFNAEDSEKEYHDEMEIMNGQEMIQYDREPNEQFKDRARKSFEGDSTMGNKTYTGDENGNTEPVWGASDAEFGKKLTKRANSSKEKRNAQTGTFNQFGDDIEMSDKAPKISKKKIATESMKRLKFKKPFNGVGNALKLIPESFRVDNKKFEMTDGLESYKMEWKGSLTEGKAKVIEANSTDLMNEGFSKIKYLMGYKSENTLGSLDSNARVNENNNIKAGLSQGFTNEVEDLTEEEETFKCDACENDDASKTCEVCNNANK